MRPGLGVSDGGERAFEGLESTKKSTIPCQNGWPLVLFFRKAYKSGEHFSWATRDRDFGVKSRERLRNGAASD